MESEGEVLGSIDHLLRTRLSSMPYKKLQKKAKRFSVRAGGKKDELIERILPFVMKEKEMSTEPDAMDTEEAEQEGPVEKITEESDDENQQPISEPDIKVIDRRSRSARRSERKSMAVRQESPMESVLNRTYSLSPKKTETKEEQSEEQADEEVEVDTQCDELPQTPTSDRNAVSTPASRASGSRPASASRLTGGRFASAHSKLHDRMQSIDEHKRRIQERHDAYQAQTPKRFRELATPRSARSVQKIAPPVFEEADPKMLTFKFGSVSPTRIASVQKKQEQEEPGPSKTGNLKVIKVKQVKKSTVPVLSKRLNELAAPKNVKRATSEIPRRVAPSSSSSSRRFAPRRGPLQYVDTTKLSDKEFERVTGKNIGTGRVMINHRKNNAEEQKLKRDRVVNHNRNIK